MRVPQKPSEPRAHLSGAETACHAVGNAKCEGHHFVRIDRETVSPKKGRSMAVFADREVPPMNLLRLIFWTAGLAYCGSFLFAGRGVQSLHDASVSGALIGAVLGLLFAFMLTRRARRRHI